jgi:hypothetical protein
MPQAMPDQYKVRDRIGTMEDTVLAYKAYYIGEKIKEIKMTYTNTEWPEWLPRQDPEHFKQYKFHQKIQLENDKLIKRQMRSIKKLNITTPIKYITLNILPSPNP